MTEQIYAHKIIATDTWRYADTGTVVDSVGYNRKAAPRECPHCGRAKARSTDPCCAGKVERGYLVYGLPRADWG